MGIKAKEVDHDFQGFGMRQTTSRRDRCTKSKSKMFPRRRTQIRKRKGERQVSQGQTGQAVAGCDGRCASAAWKSSWHLNPKLPVHGRDPSDTALTTGTAQRAGPGEHVPNIPPWAVTVANEIALLLRGEFPLANSHQTFIQYSVTSVYQLFSLGQTG